MPTSKKVDDKVFSGTIVDNGYIEIVSGLRYLILQELETVLEMVFS